MATPQLSPGIITREVDLTVGRVDNVLDNIGAIAGPFEMGPVNEAVNISNEQDLLSIFGRPLNTDNQYEYWMAASEFLSYGGVSKIVRVDGTNLKNACVGLASTTTVKIGNFDIYNSLYANETSAYVFASKTPGTWANDTKVCIVDDKADQTVSILNSKAAAVPGFGASFVGYGVTSPLVNVTIPGQSSVFNGYLKGIITGISTSDDGTKQSVDIKIISRVSNTGTETAIDYASGNSYSSFVSTSKLDFVNNSGQVVSALDSIVSVGYTGNTVPAGANTVYSNLAGTTTGTGVGASFTVSRGSTGAIASVSVASSGTGYLVGDQITIPSASVGGTTFTNPVVTSTSGLGTFFTSTAHRIGTNEPVSFGSSFLNGSTVIVASGTTYYATGIGSTSFRISPSIGGATVTGMVSGVTSPTITATVTHNDNIVLTVQSASERLVLSASNADILDWYDQQKLNLTTPIYWKSIAPKPKTNNYVRNQNGRNDALHVVVVDSKNNIIEKHLSISKALDTVSEVNSPQKIWYKSYLANYSPNVYAGYNISAAADPVNGSTPVATGFSSGFVKNTLAQGLWGQDAQDKTFSSVGAITYNLKNGSDYSTNGGMQATLADIITAYQLFSNRNSIAVDYLINGPSLPTKSESQSKAYSIISIANSRKDCIAVVSPHKDDVVGVTNTDTQTKNIIEFFSALPSTSYAVFDSGYKYTYDRFNNTFRYLACNSDIAGLMVRTNVNAYPWFSPAGEQRGVLNNAIKLAYTPNKDQRDLLYTARVNPIVNQSGVGLLLFGDKTALSYASAFDRINVRRLFLTVEQALERTANSQLFEFNDSITRANFVNIVEPYLRNVQSKRGIFDFRVICDETNNTPDVVDNNEFRADIFLKPNKSINYITLTFVATRTGISFEEVTGRV